MICKLAQRENYWWCRKPKFTSDCNIFLCGRLGRGIFEGNRSLAVRSLSRTAASKQCHCVCSYYTWKCVCLFVCLSHCVCVCVCSCCMWSVIVWMSVDTSTCQLSQAAVVCWLLWDEATLLMPTSTSSTIYVPSYQVLLPALTHSLIGMLTDWLVDWLIDWLIYLFIDWLIHWFIDWLMDWVVVLCYNGSLVGNPIWSSNGNSNDLEQPWEWR